MTIVNENQSSTENIIKDKYDEVDEVEERIDNNTFLNKNETNVFREAEQDGQYVAFEYDGKNERRSKLRELLRDL